MRSHQDEVQARKERESSWSRHLTKVEESVR
jgi:hypothetical protein